MEYDKPIALGEVRVCWKFLERRDDNEEYGVLRITYAGKLVDEQLAALDDRFDEEVAA
jgi:hypothetical protein